MHVELTPLPFLTSRGSPVVVGNVYANNRVPAFPYFRVVVAISSGRYGKQPWNCVVCLHIDVKGDIQGSSNNPLEYVRDHWDLIGHVVEMPTLKIEWLRPPLDKEES